jgi:hypothetical protein
MILHLLFSGRRFRYIKYDKSHGPIHKYIHKLDKQVSCYFVVCSPAGPLWCEL